MSEIRRKQHRFAVMVATFILWLNEQGYKIQLGDAYRSTDKLAVPGGKEGFEDDDMYSYQELLFYNQRTKITFGKHNERLAIDLIIWKDEKELKGEELRPVGEKWEGLGGRWGGRFGLKHVNGKWVNRDLQEVIGWDSGHYEYNPTSTLTPPVAI